MRWYPFVLRSSSRRRERACGAGRSGAETPALGALPRATMLRRSVALVALTLATVLFAQCRAKEDAFYAEIFSCDSRSPDHSCGTTRAGAPMACFAASQYGSTDFCADPCDPAAPPDDKFTCVGSARLQVCDPSSAASACPNPLQCRNVGSGHGLCLPGCTDASRCASMKIDPDGGPTPLVNEGSAPGIVLCGAGGSCGAASNGAPMTCVPGGSLGGQDFCAEACDPALTPADPDRFACASMGALLQRCQPNDDMSSAAGCLGGLSCFRTDLLLNQGVCMLMPVCASNADCKSGMYSTCSAAILGGTSSPAASILHLDHLNCVQSNCANYQTSCGPSEGCLGTQYASGIADICVPRCINLHCPPDFSCSRSTGGAGSPELCLPGVPGTRCDGPNCVLGSCEPSGAGFNVCTIPCSSDDNCNFLNTPGDSFVCVVSGDYQHCVTPRPFNGANCMYDTDCQMNRGEFCARYDLYGATAGHGDCRLHCKSDGTCDAQGGLPYTCLRNGDAGCYPGILGVPCKLASECISGLTCQDVVPEPDIADGSPRLCTINCAVDGGTDADGDHLCNDPHTIVHGGYCGAGSCRLFRIGGQACDRGAQCQSRLCDSSTHTCVPTP